MWAWKSRTRLDHREKDEWWPRLGMAHSDTGVSKLASGSAFAGDQYWWRQNGRGARNISLALLFIYNYIIRVSHAPHKDFTMPTKLDIKREWEVTYCHSRIVGKWAVRSHDLARAHLRFISITFFVFFFFFVLFSFDIVFFYSFVGLSVGHVMDVRRELLAVGQTWHSENCLRW